MGRLWRFTPTASGEQLLHSCLRSRVWPLACHCRDLLGRIGPRFPVRGTLTQIAGNISDSPEDLLVQRRAHWNLAHSLLQQLQRRFDRRHALVGHARHSIRRRRWSNSPRRSRRSTRRSWRSWRSTTRRRHSWRSPTRRSRRSATRHRKPSHSKTPLSTALGGRLQGGSASLQAPHLVLATAVLTATPHDELRHFSLLLVEQGREHPDAPELMTPSSRCQCSIERGCGPK